MRGEAARGFARAAASAHPPDTAASCRAAPPPPAPRPLTHLPHPSARPLPPPPPPPHRYGHRSDGLIHLVMVRKCSRLQYLRFLLTLSSTGERGSRGIGRPGGWAMACVHGATTSSPSRAPPATAPTPPPRLPLPPPPTATAGLAAGDHGYFRVVPAVAVHVEPLGPRQSRWNADGELLPSNHITGGVGRGGWGSGVGGGLSFQGHQAMCVRQCLNCVGLLQRPGGTSCPYLPAVPPPPAAAEVHRGVVECFARGVEV